MSEKGIETRNTVRWLITVIIGAVALVIASEAAYGVSNMEGIAIEKMPSAELLERSNRYIKATQQPDSAVIYLKVLGSRSHKTSLTTEEMF